ncbi:MAG TPA: tetratricopeptide repeat protein [Methanomassiliicoccales archaeon]|nr:tetratricopeptide repeat protein [Methanomassiliicoccales archaeon]
MPSAVTIGERILLHLAQYSKHHDDFDAPMDVSQDGIAEALRISRAHAAIELKKLKESGEVVERLAHIRRGPTKRKVYFLTESGEARAQRLRDFVSREGIELAPLLDLKKCKGPELWGSLDDELRVVLGKACVFRKPFRRDLLPPTTVSLLPEDKEGMVDMPSELRSIIPKLLDGADLREYHSLAADYWLRNNDHRERLYHLIKAGRMMEAEMLLANQGSVLMLNPDKDLDELCHSVPSTSKRYGPRILDVQGNVSLSQRDIEGATEAADRLMAMEDAECARNGSRIKARTFALQGRHDEALKVLNTARSNEDAPNILMENDHADILCSLGRSEEAKCSLISLLQSGRFKDDPDAVELLYHQIGKVMLSSGDANQAVHYLSKALGMARPGDKRRIHESMCRAYERLGMMDKAKEHAAKAGIRISS